MLRTLTSKVAWVGRTASMVFGLALVLALVVGVTSMAFGANGQPFILGQNNAATLLTKLTGNVNGSAVQIVNNNPDLNDQALNLQVQPGEAPMRVNSTGKVANLNADKLDNLEPSQIKGARAYARVLPNPAGSPSFDSVRTSGFTAVSRSATGNYCLTPAGGVNPANRPAVVTVDFQTTSNPEANASAAYNDFGCGRGAFQVTTQRTVLSGGALSDEFSDTVGFVIVVP